jgi:anti-sigma B factor antagonist
VSAAADGGVVVRVVGELDLATAPEVQHRLAGLALAAERRVVLDVQDVTFLSAAGVRVLLDAHDRVAAHGGRLVLRSPSRLVQRVLQAAGVGDVLPVERLDGDGDGDGHGVNGEGATAR